MTSTSTNSGTVTISFAPGYEISAGQSKIFSLFGVISGAPAASITPYVASSLTASGFQWKDVIGANTQYAGTNIINFPTTSYTTAR